MAHTPLHDRRCPAPPIQCRWIVRQPLPAVNCKTASAEPGRDNSGLTALNAAMTEDLLPLHQPFLRQPDPASRLNAHGSD